MSSSADEASALDFDPAALRKKYVEERQKRLRDDGTAQYRRLTGEFSRLAADPYVDPGFVRDAVNEEADVVILGGGLSGLTTAARLRQQGVTSIRIIEKGGDFGGVWYWNRYPGAACDIESYIYMPLLEEVGYMPTEKYARATEIFEYCRMLARHFDLYAGALFQTSVTSLKWDEPAGRWIVSTTRNDCIKARFVIVAGGFLSVPKLPGIPGIETFAGHSFHTSRWDYEYTGGNHLGGLSGLADKRVGIIGTGSTAIQCAPMVAESAAHLYVFQRTPSSIDSRGNQKTDPEWSKNLKPGWQRRRMVNFNNLCSGVPEDEDLVRDSWTDLMKDLSFLMSSSATTDPAKIEISMFARMEQNRRKIASIVQNPETAAALKPYYNYLCKRPGFSDLFLQMFNRPNVTLVDTGGKGVDRLTSTGAVFDGKEYQLDCLIFATGYEFASEVTSAIGFEVYGREGRTLTQKWGEGVRTLHGLTTRGFPNLMVLGFAQNGIPINFTHLAEERARHVAFLVKACIDGNIRSFEPTQEAEDRWVDGVLAGRVARRAWFDACPPSYYNQEGKDTPATSLNDIYPAGPVAFFKVLEDWRAEGSLAGLDLVRDR